MPSGFVNVRIRQVRDDPPTRYDDVGHRTLPADKAEDLQRRPRADRRL
jgi:hypothetical protein